MQIKRRLNAIAKKLTPELEALNIGIEMQRICKRLEELVEYGEAKVEKAKEREKTGMSMGERIAKERLDKENARKRAQEQANQDMIQDQLDAKAEREGKEVDAELDEMEQRADAEAAATRPK